MKVLDISTYQQKSLSPFVIIMRRFMRNRASVISASIVLILFIIAAFAPYISPYDPNGIDVNKILIGPSWEHPFGTDELGRDVLSRMIWGSRISLMVGFVAVGIAVCIGIFLGSIGGYYGGRIDAFIMRCVDVMLSFPVFFLILAVIAFLEPSIWNIMIIIGCTGWMGVCRLVRAEFLRLKEMDFVLAARAQGMGDLRIIFRHILPNSLAPVFVSAILGISGAILTESALSFLGIGVQPPQASWGNILSSGKDNIEIAWWLSFFPGLAILVTVLSYNLLGEGLRDALDPRLRI